MMATLEKLSPSTGPTVHLDLAHAKVGDGVEFQPQPSRLNKKPLPILSEGVSRLVLSQFRTCK
jgi:hypothetical protein